MRSTHDATSWDGEHPERPRVLLECPPEQSPTIIADMVKRKGYEVRICEGPEANHTCQLTDEGACELVSGADVVVNMLVVQRGRGREIAAAVAAERRPPELVLEVTGTADGPDELGLHPSQVVASPVTPGNLIAAIDRALDRGAREVPWRGDGVP